MSRILLSSALLATSLCASLPAVAMDGLYGGAAIGLTRAQDTSASGTSGGSVDLDTGTGASAFVGATFAANWRGEVELARRTLDISSVAGTSGSGDVSATSLMANAIYDLNLDTELAVQPYVGAGIGLTNLDLDGAAPFGGSTIDDSDTVGALQAIAGVSYPLNAQTTLFADYRYFATRDADFTTAAGASTSLDMRTHSLMAGLRFEFGAPGTSGDAGMSATAQSLASADAAPVSETKPTEIKETEALPAHTLPETYTVYFVLNNADVTPEGIVVIEQAAANAKARSVTRLILTGHADRSGDAAYNLSLSKRRAEAVKTAFVALGFDESEITIKAKGETELLVPTADGKWEPKNRRVEIVVP